MWATVATGTANVTGTVFYFYFLRYALNNTSGVWATVANGTVFYFYFLRYAFKLQFCMQRPASESWQRESTRCAPGKRRPVQFLRALKIAYREQKHTHSFALTKRYCVSLYIELERFYKCVFSLFFCLPKLSFWGHLSTDKKRVKYYTNDMKCY